MTAENRHAAAFSDEWTVLKGTHRLRREAGNTEMKKMIVHRQKRPSGYYTVAEVADILRVTTRTVHTYLHKDGLPYLKVGKNDLIGKEDLSYWIRKQTGMNLTEWRNSLEK